MIHSGIVISSVKTMITISMLSQSSGDQTLWNYMFFNIIIRSVFFKRRSFTSTLQINHCSKIIG